MQNLVRHLIQLTLHWKEMTKRKGQNEEKNHDIFMYETWLTNTTFNIAHKQIDMVTKKNWSSKKWFTKPYFKNLIIQWKVNNAHQNISHYRIEVIHVMT